MVVVVVVAVVFALLPQDGYVDTDCGGVVFVDVLCVRALTSFCRSAVPLFSGTCGTILGVVIFGVL